MDLSFSEKIFRVGFERSIEEELNKRKMSIKELAKRAGIPSSTLYKIMTGERDPRLSTIMKIWKAFQPKAENFIAIIAAKFVLDKLEMRETRINDKVYKIREYPSFSLEEALISAVRAEKEGAIGIICAPIIASTVEKLVDVHVVIMKPGGEVLKNAILNLVKKLES